MTYASPLRKVLRVDWGHVREVAWRTVRTVLAPPESPNRSTTSSPATARRPPVAGRRAGGPRRISSARGPTRVARPARTVMRLHRRPAGAGHLRPIGHSRRRTLRRPTPSRPDRQHRSRSGPTPIRNVAARPRPPPARPRSHRRGVPEAPRSHRPGGARRSRHPGPAVPRRPRTTPRVTVPTSPPPSSRWSRARRSAPSPATSAPASPTSASRPNAPDAPSAARPRTPAPSGSTRR